MEPNKSFHLLKKMIRIPSVHTNPKANNQMISLIENHLVQLGFSVSVEGYNQSVQPTIVAHRPAVGSSKKLVIYGHYDVAEVCPNKPWRNADPFVLEEHEGRLYGRGIADNKGVLWARIIGLQHIINTEKPCPELLWLIQGEEEINREIHVAQNVFATHIAQFGSSVFIEETGFNDASTGEQIAFLWSPHLSKEQVFTYSNLLVDILDSPRLEYRHLNKLAGMSHCPLLSNLPNDAIYLGFGPNDKFHNIHRENESLDRIKLMSHIDHFSRFLMNYATQLEARPL